LLQGFAQTASVKLKVAIHVSVLDATGPAALAGRDYPGPTAIDQARPYRELEQLA
jgi:hypothetical protein